MRLIPHNELEREQHDSFEWRALGIDPQFLLVPSLGRWLPGWRMLELTIEHDQACATARVFLDTGHGFTEAESLCLRLSSGQAGKRVLFLPASLKALRFDPLESEGRFTLKRLRLIWLTPRFARDRLLGRLLRVHPDWRGKTKTLVLQQLKQRARAQDIHWRNLALEHYNATFDHRTVQENYKDWLEERSYITDTRARAAAAQIRHRPLISIVLPVYNTRTEWLRECLDSALEQSYAHWQLCIADDHSSDPAVRDLIADYAARDPRITFVFRESNGHVCAASNSALELARGEFIALLDHDDRLHPHALLHVAEALQSNPQAGLLYSDEDKINAQGQRFDPHFKPDWNPDLLLAQNYISHLGIYRTDIVREVGAFGRALKERKITILHCVLLRV